MVRHWTEPSAIIKTHVIGISQYKVSPHEALNVIICWCTDLSQHTLAVIKSSVALGHQTNDIITQYHIILKLSKPIPNSTY